MEDISVGVTFKLKDWKELGMERVRGIALSAQGMACTEALRQRELGVFRERKEAPEAGARCTPRSWRGRQV